MHGARAPVDGDVEITLAPFTITGLQLRQMFDVDVNKTKIIFFKGSFSLDRSGAGRSGPTMEPIRLQNAPDAVAIEMREEVSNDKGEVIQRKVSDPAQSAN